MDFFVGFNGPSKIKAELDHVFENVGKGETIVVMRPRKAKGPRTRIPIAKLPKFKQIGKRTGPKMPRMK